VERDVKIANAAMQRGQSLIGGDPKAERSSGRYASIIALLQTDRIPPYLPSFISRSLPEAASEFESSRYHQHYPRFLRSMYGASCSLLFSFTLFVACAPAYFFHHLLCQAAPRRSAAWLASKRLLLAWAAGMPTSKTSTMS